jgi:CRISPR/Cas system-associated endonuclease/helicase Cas3
LQTNFIKFLIEKYEKQIQELPEEETNLSDNKLSDEFDRIINGEEEREEIQDEVQDEPENDDENIDDLIKEYRLLEKKIQTKIKWLHSF